MCMHLIESFKIQEAETNRTEKKIDKSTVIVKDFKTLYSIASRQKIRRYRRFE